MSSHRNASFVYSYGECIANQIPNSNAQFRPSIMVQIQSTWFPVIDRNPQKFVHSIYKATASDFTPATQHIYCSPELPSHVVLPVTP